MQSKRSLFQVIVLSLFGLFAVLGLIFFATYSSKNKEIDLGRVIIWGTIEQQTMNNFLRDLRADSPVFKKVYYVEYPEHNFNEKVTDALAAGEGPDIIILKHEDLLKYKNKIFPVSYETFSKRDFKDKFIDGAEIFMAPEGILAIPFAVDPLVLYYNRDIFADNAVVEPPKLWKQIPGLSAKMTVRDKANNIDIATISLGAYDNITHAYSILATLAMQAGANVTKYDPNSGRLYSGFSGNGAKQASKALRFFTAFANPVSNVYTWNRSLPESLEMFVQDRLAMYIGFASDLPIILSKQPHLNFDVAPLPQVDKADKDQRTRTYGRFWAFAITKASTNKRGSYNFVVKLFEPKYAQKLSESLGISGVQRVLLAKEPEDPLDAVFRNSAIISHAFLDPDPKATETVLSKMVNNTISGQSFVDKAVSLAGAEIQKIIDNYYAE